MRLSENFWRFTLLIGCLWLFDQTLPTIWLAILLICDHGMMPSAQIRGAIEVIILDYQQCVNFEILFNILTNALTYKRRQRNAAFVWPVMWSCYSSVCATSNSAKGKFYTIVLCKNLSKTKILNLRNCQQRVYNFAVGFKRLEFWNYATNGN